MEIHYLNTDQKVFRSESLFSRHQDNFIPVLEP